MSISTRTVFLVCIAAVSFLAGAWYGRRPEVTRAASGGQRILYYHDPMHPAYKSDKPGIAPDCGMQLEAVYAGDSGSLADGQPVSTGSMQISSEKRRSIGLVTDTVRRESERHTVHVLGRVGLDETKVVRVTVAVDGWLRTTAPIAVGTIVEKGSMLATFYNRDFLTAQQTYLYALGTMDRLKGEENAEQLKLVQAQMQAAEENLEFLGMGEAQCREIARTRQIARDIEITSPIAGIVLARNTFAGLRFDRNTELVRIADLHHVWVYADLFENEAALARTARGATVRCQGRTFPAHISDTLPQFDGATRALKIRLDLDNPGLALRPDMFVDVDFAVVLPAGIAVPSDAVIDSGLHKTVYVESASGSFEPRQVETGWRLGDRVQITKGVESGERIVVAGNFLLDSESRMKLGAANGAAPGTQDRVCGMDLDTAKAAGKMDYQGKTYYFCSKSCREKFEKDPGKYAGQANVALAGGQP
jgi:Cu(I)/Ag(I) efflux system membrane fusion protein